MARAGSGVRRRDAPRSLLGAHHLAEVSAHAPPGGGGLLANTPRPHDVGRMLRRTLTPRVGAIRAVARHLQEGPHSRKKANPRTVIIVVVVVVVVVGRNGDAKTQQTLGVVRRETVRVSATRARRGSQGTPGGHEHPTSSSRVPTAAQTLDATYSNPAGKSTSSINITGVGSVPRHVRRHAAETGRVFRALWSTTRPHKLDIHNADRLDVRGARFNSRESTKPFRSMRTISTTRTVVSRARPFPPSHWIPSRRAR